MTPPPIHDREVPLPAGRDDGAPPSPPGARPVLITGGAGFIGCNVAHSLLRQGVPVILFDNLSRAGGRTNAAWLQAIHGPLVTLVEGDVRDRDALRRVMRRCSHVHHFAAQVTVKSSVVDPTFDFEVNALGTLNVLEAMRAMREPPSLVYTSTNKVYGALDDVLLRTHGTRYEPRAAALREAGVSEERQLDFHSPHGCSKGTADQYVRDYARTYGLRTVVMRVSCIYGPRQFGIEDQGWVAHFLIRALDGETIDLYGDGLQVRDILFVDDLVRALLLAQQHAQRLRGQVFNIGGGPERAVSLLELLDLIEELGGTRPSVRRHDRRVGDQRYYVSDTRRFSEATGWTPRVAVADGVRRLRQWLAATREELTTLQLAEAAEAAIETRRGVLRPATRAATVDGTAPLVRRSPGA